MNQGVFPDVFNGSMSMNPLSLILLNRSQKYYTNFPFHVLSCDHLTTSSSVFIANFYVFANIYEYIILF